ncbi:MAG: hypothetical protein AAF682_09275 [Planctomycetota bacterium]
MTLCLRLRGLRAVVPLALLASAPWAQSVWYVDAAATGPELGTKALPFITINAAIANAAAGDTINVLDGTYNEVVRVDKPLQLEALPTATIQVQSEDAFSGTSRDVGIILDSSMNALGPDTLVRGFTILAPESSAQLTTGILATDFGLLIGETMTPSHLSNSPVIEQNRVFGCQYGVVVEAVGDKTICAPRIVRNTLFGGELCSDGQAAAGVEAGNFSGGFMEVSMRANRIFGFESGVFVYGDQLGPVFAQTDGNLVAFCESGFYLNPATVVVSVNDTIAYSAPSSPLSQAAGIVNLSDDLTLVNTLIWVPDDESGASPCPLPPLDLAPDLVGNAPTALSGGFVTEDAAPAGYDPAFVNVFGVDFRLQSTSSAIDAGIGGPLTPGQFLETPDDNVGGARFANPRLSPLSTSVAALVDQGAFELSSVELAVTSAYGGSLPPEDSLHGTPIYTDRVYDVQQNAIPATTLGLRGRGGDICLVLTAAVTPTNALDPVLGNLMIDPFTFVSIPVPLSPAGPDQTIGTLPISLGALPAESTFDMQAAFVRINAAGVIDGGFSRRVRFEVNE